MRGCLFLGILAVGVVSGASAYPLQGLGTQSCAQFADAYANSPDYAELAYFSWGQGYMSGLNMETIAQGGRARDLSSDADQQKQALRRYCANNPLKNYMDAVFDIYKRMPVSTDDVAGAPRPR